MLCGANGPTFMDANRPRRIFITNNKYVNRDSAIIRINMDFFLVIKRITAHIFTTGKSSKNIYM